MSLESLPTELLEFIFNFLDFNTKLALTNVSRKFQNILKNGHLWKSDVLTVKTFNDIIENEEWSVDNLRFILSLKINGEKIFKHVLNQKNNSTLVRVCQKGHLGYLMTLIQAGADVNIRIQYGDRPVNVAAKNGHIDCVKTLIQAGADVNITDRNGHSPVHKASQNGHIECVKTLIQAGADVNITDNDGCSPVYEASRNGHIDSVKTLIEAGAAVNIISQDGYIPVYEASRNGHIDCVKTLIEAGADVNKTYNDG